MPDPCFMGTSRSSLRMTADYPSAMRDSSYLITSPHPAAQRVALTQFDAQAQTPPLDRSSSVLAMKSRASDSA
jgi:hypothetical protein